MRIIKLYRSVDAAVLFLDYTDYMVNFKPQHINPDVRPHPTPFLINGKVRGGKYDILILFRMSTIQRVEN